MSDRELVLAIMHDQALRDGLKAGWNLGVAEDRERYEAAVGAITERIIEAKRELASSA